MAYLTIESFKYGLDTRRSVLTSQPGACVTLQNCHINQGGEIEKRKSLFHQALPTSFGLQETSQGFAVFGTATNASYDQWPTFGTTWGGNTPVSYVKVAHPDGSTAANGVVHSTVYSDIPFAIVSFTNGDVFAYYGTTIVLDFFSGVASSFMVSGGVINRDALASHLNLLFNGNSLFTAIQHLTYTDGSQVTFNQFNVLAVDKTTTVANPSGILVAVPDSSGVEPIQSVQAIAGFKVVSSEVGDLILSIDHIATVNGAPVSTTLAANVPTFDDSAVTALTAAQFINAASYATGYSAYASGNVVSIFSATDVSDSSLSISTTGGTCIDEYGVTFGGTVFSITDFKIDGVSILTGKQFGFNFGSRAITAAAFVSGTSWKYTTAAAHNIVVGASITLSGFTGGGVGNNVTGVVTAITTVTPFTFTIVNATGTATITGTPVVGLTVNYTTKAALVSALKADIILNATYTARADDIKLFISRRVVTDTSPTLSAVWTYTGNGVETSAGALDAKVSGVDFTAGWYKVPNTGGQWRYQTPWITAKPTGGVPPYTYVWSFVGETPKFQTHTGYILNPTAPSVSAVFDDISYTNFTPQATEGASTQMKCIVTDSDTPPKVAQSPFITILY